MLGSVAPTKLYFSLHYQLGTGLWQGLNLKIFELLFVPQAWHFHCETETCVIPDCIHDLPFPQLLQTSCSWLMASSIDSFMLPISILKPNPQADVGRLQFCGILFCVHVYTRILTSPTTRCKVLTGLKPCMRMICVYKRNLQQNDYRSRSPNSLMWQ